MHSNEEASLERMHDSKKGDTDVSAWRQIYFCVDAVPGINEFSQTKLANTGTRRIVWNLAVIEINWYRNKIFNNNNANPYNSWEKQAHREYSQSSRNSQPADYRVVGYFLEKCIF